MLHFYGEGAFSPASEREYLVNIVVNSENDAGTALHTGRTDSYTRLSMQM